MSILGQPRKLYLFSLSELWERYAYYTMHGIFVLYMTKRLGFSDANAYSIFAIFSAVLYLVPIIGGFVADRFLGSKLSVIFGGLILSLGYSLLSYHQDLLYYGLATIIIGSGLFMPNISSMVSSLYNDRDQRKDGAFSIFYTAINVGALFPPLVVASLIHRLGWHAAFTMSALSVLLGVVIFVIVTKKIKFDCRNLKLFNITSLVILALLLIFVISSLMSHPLYANDILFIISLVFIVFVVYRCSLFEAVVRNRLFACIALILLSIVFSVLYQQAGMSLTIFAEFNVSRVQSDYTIPTVMFQFLNPFFIIILGPLLAKLWSSLAHKNKNPSTPIKFGLGTIFMGAGFAILPLCIAHHNAVGHISPWWLVLSYFLQTMGEMFVSPIGLSMVSELSPAKIMGLMMGVWYFATAVADAIAGYVARWTTIPSGTNNPILTGPLYSHIFGSIGVIALLVGVVILFLNRFFKKYI